MNRTVWCHKLQKEAPGLPHFPYPGALGQRIFEHISQEAWEMWIQQQTMLINEHRLSMIDPEARKFILHETEKFLFGGDFQPPPGYKPLA